MKKTGLVIGLSVLLAACGGSNEEPLDAPEEAPLAGGEEADAKLSSEDATSEAKEAKTEAETDEKPEEAKQASTAPNTIPARFHGKWGREGWDCVSYDDSIFDVSASFISYPESGGKVTSVEMDGDDVIVKLKVEDVDEELYDQTHRLTLLDGQLYVLEPENRYDAGDEGLDRCK